MSLLTILRLYLLIGLIVAVVILAMLIAVEKSNDDDADEDIRRAKEEVRRAGGPHSPVVLAAVAGLLWPYSLFVFFGGML